MPAGAGEHAVMRKECRTMNADMMRHAYKDGGKEKNRAGRRGNGLPGLTALLLSAAVCLTACSSGTPAGTESDSASENSSDEVQRETLSNYEWVMPDTDAPEDTSSYVDYVFDAALLPANLTAVMTDADRDGYALLIAAVTAHADGFRMGEKAYARIEGLLDESAWGGLVTSIERTDEALDFYVPASGGESDAGEGADTESSAGTDADAGADAGADADADAVADADADTDKGAGADADADTGADDRTDTAEPDGEDPVRGWKITYRFDREEHAAKIAAFEEAFSLIMNRSGILHPRRGTADVYPALAAYAYVTGQLTYDFSDTCLFDSVIAGSYGDAAYGQLFALMLAHVGLNTLRIQAENGHSFPAAELGGKYFLFDPAYEFMDTSGKGLSYFGMNEADRTAEGLGDAFLPAVTAYWSQPDSGYAFALSCTSSRYELFRNTAAWEFSGDGTVTLYYRAAPPAEMDLR